MGKSKKGQKEKLENVLYTLPAIVFVTMMMYIPFVMSGYYSLTEWNGISKEPKFVGLANFIDLFTGDKSYLTSLWFTMKYTIFFVIVSKNF